MKKLAIGLYVLVTVALLGWAYYQAIYVAPNDAAQGEMFRIIYYHVPSASVAFAFFAVSLIGSIGYLASRHNHPDREGTGHAHLRSPHQGQQSEQPQEYWTDVHRWKTAFPVE